MIQEKCIFGFIESIVGKYLYEVKSLLFVYASLSSKLVLVKRCSLLH